jgi:hypothetical protein
MISTLIEAARKNRHPHRHGEAVMLGHGGVADFDALHGRQNACRWTSLPLGVLDTGAKL